MSQLCEAWWCTLRRPRGCATLATWGPPR
eukprot:jgi/Mesen1/7536/ME000391S06777